MFPNNLQPAQQVTGQESVDTNQSLAQYLQQQATAQQQPQPPAAQPISFQDPLTGQTMTVKDGAELKAYLDGIISSASAVYEEKDRALREMQQRQAQVQAQAQASGQPEPFNKERYHELLMSDPFAAQDYLESLHPSRAAQTANQAMQAMQQLQAYQQQLYRQQLNEQFKQRVPDFPWQDQVALQAVNSIQQQLGLPPTVDAYEAAYELAKKRGMIPSAAAPQQRDSRQLLMFPSAEERPGIPMVPIGGQPTSPSEDAQLRAFMQLPQEQRDDYVQREGLPALLGLRRG